MASQYTIRCTTSVPWQATRRASTYVLGLLAEQDPEKAVLDRLGIHSWTNIYKNSTMEATYRDYCQSQTLLTNIVILTVCGIMTIGNSVPQITHTLPERQGLLLGINIAIKWCHTRRRHLRILRLPTSIILSLCISYHPVARSGIVGIGVPRDIICHQLHRFRSEEAVCQRERRGNIQQEVSPAELIITWNILMTFACLV
ncbi:uncharacterized protein EV422DRAFT_166984 [Fimicolochytrium jonesii]|uniref:uncharacterized protein n=1 Tax=Fimicolochytrium jonesii TaxID=1396493 RepID=UPI0022FE7F59|nr:uncharacterized protein EV422DRAFT_166984 [Fimicolochytrium jonesii]KAI8818832.1 hypothetical protein EV422DRAFT_166984 [Fimicolochytrium jonesii]